MTQRPVQVDASSHYQRRYLTLPRMVTHWHQANEVANQCPNGGSVLEIGPGSGHTTWMLSKWGYKVTTLDFDPKISPTIVGDVTRLPFASAVFDCVIAAEVLEHIPFAEFANSVGELGRVSRGPVIITLPAPFVGLSALLNLPRIDPIGISIGLPFWVRHRFNGEHYWELGKRGYELKRIRAEITAAGLEVLQEFRPAPSLYSYFLVLRRV